MTFSQIFENYYTLYRGEADVPASTDEEFTIALRFANNAINRWANVDGTYWKELYTTLQNTIQLGLVKTTTSGTRTYAAPTTMREAGGYVELLKSGQVQQRLEIIEPQEAQFKADDTPYAYFTGNPTGGFTLNLMQDPGDTFDIDYVYYKKATEFTTGSSTTEMSNPWFIVHHALANRLRVSQNYSGYQTALRDAEEALKNMQLDNASGTWANPWKLADNSGTVWGA